jgi:hypothetical protein
MTRIQYVMNRSPLRFAVIGEYADWGSFSDLIAGMNSNDVVDILKEK